MELLDHRRRRSGSGAVRSDETAEGEAGYPREGPTALSQGGHFRGDSRAALGGSGQVTPRTGGAMVAESVSPGAMERGLVASPFYSDLIKSEVALRNNRPSTLDRDARLLGLATASLEDSRSGFTSPKA